MRVLRLVLPMMLALLAFLPGEASSRECRWFGTAPFCSGSCPSGWEPQLFRGRPFRAPCVTGSKVSCCRINTCGPATYGTPGCPYPGFGTAKPAPSCPGGTFGRYPRCRKIPGGGCGPGLRGTPPDCYPDVR